jgi:hypothetical protein
MPAGYRDLRTAQAGTRNFLIWQLPNFTFADDGAADLAAHIPLHVPRRRQMVQPVRCPMHIYANGISALVV